MSIDFSAKRLSYEKGELDETCLPNEPYPLLQRWINEALDTYQGEAYAFALATCGADNKPSVRTLLMREIITRDDEIALVFYSNYDSEKGQDLAENPNAEALFFWASLEQQIRLTGKVDRLSREQSARYFHTRPIDSQLGAWVSQPQSGVVASRSAMNEKFNQLAKQYQNCNIPLPDFWGGYQLTVDKIEFWQGRANRMHDRIVYQKVDHHWQIKRLLP
ncbi:pyridoxamine 5'-phosphate oxidase [Moraxella macacae 0408225]|uniref:Pyridoxine/pyridoxamine 5'-phosphate oxidase n=1 Tax=Moraxella macacae 0408225 TaxID=1230338 RepID=L2F7F3_9GAMM|nr:pyridoxamine 5'-phosphate oxidase [Moraxella macacae]ELA08691.1 pyridoxamine 5'-phosphate oxidase [Moraxella macacae 0408225]